MKDIVRYYDSLGKDGMKVREIDVGMEDDFETVGRLVTEGERVLDLACGYGRLTSLMARLGANAYGLDISPVLINSAQQDACKAGLNNLSYLLGDMRNLPYDPEFFDKVFCFWNSFVHMLTTRDQTRCLMEIYRVLKLSGYCYMVLPDASQEPWKSKLERTAGSSRIAVDQILVRQDNGYEELLNLPCFVHSDETIRSIVSRTAFDYELEHKFINNCHRIVLHLFKSKTKVNAQ